MYRVGIDLGGTNIKVGIVNENNEIVNESSIPTRKEREAEMIVEDMARLTIKLLNQKNISLEQVLALGIGSPGVIDGSKGVVLYSNNFSWEHVPLTQMIRKHIDLPVFIANDAQCAGLGELKAGAAMGCENIILITLGTGVGGCFIVNGKIFEGGHSGGGIIGHMVLVQDGECCTCGRKGCLEAYASATALIRDTKRAIEKFPESLIARLCTQPDVTIDGKTAFTFAKEHDFVAQQIIDKYISYLGDGIANLVDVFRPDKILLSGGICNEGKNLFEPLNMHVQNKCFAGDKLYIPKVERATLRNRAGIIGAASLITVKMEN